MTVDLSAHNPKSRAGQQARVSFKGQTGSKSHGAYQRVAKQSDQAADFNPRWRNRASIFGMRPRKAV